GAFAPDGVVVDHLPLGKFKELADVVVRCPAKKFFVMRGVMGEPAAVRREVLGDRGEIALENFYSYILVAADERICDVVTEYGLNPRLAGKVRYLGYVS